MADFVQSLREKRPPTVSGADGVRALRAVRDIIAQVQAQERARATGDRRDLW